MSEIPSTNRDNGRDNKGRFVAGYNGGPGNPHAKKVHEYRAALFSAVSKEDIQDIMRAMVTEAKQGNVFAAKLALSYIVGDPVKIPEGDRPDYGDATDVLDMIPRDKLLELAK